MTEERVVELYETARSDFGNLAVGDIFHGVKPRGEERGLKDKELTLYISMALTFLDNWDVYTNRDTGEITSLVKLRATE